MSLLRVTDPAPLFTVAELKKHLRVETDEDDALIDALGQAAVDQLDGAEGWLGRCLAPQTWDWFVQGCDFPDTAWRGPGLWRLTLPLTPIISVDAIEYQSSTDGTLTAWTDFDAFGLGVTAGPAWIAPIYGGSWPSVRFTDNPVRIRFTAGYAKDDGEDPAGVVEAVPFAIKAAIKLQVGELYANRETGAARLSPAVEALLQPYRVWRV